MGHDHDTDGTNRHRARRRWGGAAIVGLAASGAFGYGLRRRVEKPWGGVCWPDDHGHGFSVGSVGVVWLDHHGPVRIFTRFI